MATRTAGRLQRQARGYLDALERQETAAATELLAAWSDAYWAARERLDALLAEVARLRELGTEVPPWRLTRLTRYRALIDTATRELLRYSAQVAVATQAQQGAALAQATQEALALAVAAAPASVAASLIQVNPANLPTMVGFMGNGSPLVDHLAATLADDAPDALRRTLAKGLTQGWGQDKMVREFTRTIAVPHTRAVTILRTESLRVYRETSRATYAANPDVVASWTWCCALDRRSCVACIAMHGTVHPTSETLDGHPRCRCAMLPTTRPWRSLGVDADDPAPLETGEVWLARQSPTYQRAVMGPGKYDLYAAGDLSLADMVARADDLDWGTMRTERSLKAIREGRNANWFDPIPANS